jgi:hypothetical protein
MIDRSPPALPRTKVTAAFLGLSVAGPLDATHVRTPEEFDSIFGRETPGYLSYAVHGWFENGGGSCFVAALDPSTDDGVDALLAGRSSGLSSIVAEGDVDLVSCPDVEMLARSAGQIDRGIWKAIQLELIQRCEEAQDRLVLLDTPPSLSVEECHDWRINEAGYFSPYGVLYYPWISVARPLSPVRVPPCGHVAGVYARAAENGGLLRRPSNFRLNGVVDVERVLRLRDRDLLYQVDVNPIRVVSRWGVRTWGTRTLSMDPSTREVARVRILARICQRLRTNDAILGSEIGMSSEESGAGPRETVATAWSESVGDDPPPIELVSHSSEKLVLCVQLDDEVQVFFVRTPTMGWSWQTWPDS